MNQDYVGEPNAVPVVPRKELPLGAKEPRPQALPPLLQPMRDLWQWRHVVHALVEASERSTFNRMSLGIAWKYIEVMFFAFTYYFFVVILSHADPSEGGHILATILSGMMVFEWARKTMLSSCNVLLSHQNLAVTTSTPIAVIVVLGFYHNTHSSFPLWITGLVTIGFVYGGFDYHLLGLLPIALVLGLCLFPICVILAYLGTYFRDLGKILELVMRILFLLSPVVYESSRVPAHLRFLVTINPFTRFIDSARTALWGQDWPRAFPLVVALVGAAFLWAMALLMLQRVGRKVVKAL
jgi:homopolymeric O-antigen transport system permease protein